MNELTLEQIEARLHDINVALQICDAASSYPWLDKRNWVINPHSPGGRYTTDDAEALKFYGGEVICESVTADNARFIAFAREGWPEALRNERRLLRAIHDMLYATAYKEAVLVLQGSFADETSAMERQK